MTLPLPRTFTAESLAVELAKRTRLLRDVVRDQYDAEADEPGMLRGFFEAFREYLIGSLTPGEFADLFAQTITYGLFAARIRAGEGFQPPRRVRQHPPRHRRAARHVPLHLAG